MKPHDKNYLALQFREKIFLKNGSEYQQFFESIMEKVFLDFQKNRNYGNDGDGGNDGYRKESGIYYQVYAPRVPKINERKAAKKLQRDFQTLKNQWDEISNIREYNFVYNNKYDGSVQLLEEAISKLKSNNQNIEFKLYLAKNLEINFFSLKESDILDLGFNVDLRQSIKIAYRYLENLKIELDRENTIIAQKILDISKDIILGLDDNDLSLEYEILECICLQKFEKVDEAKKNYENISRRFPKDARPILYLAELYLLDKNFDKNSQLLEKAEGLNKNFWLLEIEQITRKLNIGETIDIEYLDEKKFSDNPRIKACFYQLYGIHFEFSGDHTNADSFIEKAVKLNPDRFNIYLDKLTLLENRMIFNQDISQRMQMSQELLDLIDKVEKKFNEYGDIRARVQASLNLKKLSGFLVQENYQEFERLSKDTFDLAITCYFDMRIEQIFIRILQFVSLPDNDLSKFLEYLLDSKVGISDDLANVLVAQFNMQGTLNDDGISFFEKTHNQKYVEFINDLNNNNYEKVVAFLMQNIGFAVIIANSHASSPELRKKIIENLPDDAIVQKEKLRLLLSFDEKDYEVAFQILQKLDLSNLSYVECKPMLQIAQQKKAWDFEILILEKLLEKERNEKEIFYLNSHLFNAFLNLKKYLEVLDLGEYLLKVDATRNLLDLNNKEALLSNTIKACFERGKIDTEAFSRAKELLQKYPMANPSFEFKAGVEAELYLHTGDAEYALKSVIDGIKTKKVFSSQEYARLFFLFVKIGNQMDLNLVPLKKVQENTFVKLSNNDQWYFVGHDNELDALLIGETNNKYSLFINKQLGDIVSFENKYRSGKYEEKIEIIYSIEKYVLWQIQKNFQKLTQNGDLEGVQMIETPMKGDTIDFQNLLKFFEDQNSKVEPFFDMYCKKPIPLAMLALNEGGLVNAIARIQQENKGFINFCDGTEELEKQKLIAQKIVREKTPFYIDGTSALFLSETGVLVKLIAFLPSLKVPQSVITLLADITDKFLYTSWHSGYLGYTKGKINVSKADKERWNSIRSNYISSIKYFESNPLNISIISSANKSDYFFEKEITSELADAYILAQKENIPLLTDDFLYLKFNEIESQKLPPEYFSSLALMRVLYDEGLITFEEYLDYFGYLSSYRFRFLSINPDDIEIAVFGKGENKFFKPENIYKLNFPLTLSEEYGVSFNEAFRVVEIFLFRLVINNDIAVDAVEKIFVEIIEIFPTKLNKKEVGRMLIRVCINWFKNNKRNNFCRLEDKLRYQKIERILQISE